MNLEFDDRAECGVTEADVATVVNAVLTAEGVGEVEAGPGTHGPHGRDVACCSMAGADGRDFCCGPATRYD